MVGETGRVWRQVFDLLEGGVHALLEELWIEAEVVIKRHWEGTVSSEDRYKKKLKGLLVKCSVGRRES